MMRRAQASLEYMFMIVIAIVMIVLAIRRFFDPRFGTIRRTGTLQQTYESMISNEMEDKIND
ncbi:hypothetical protein CL1_0171 [Thermococcus cleftensis]|uniref:Uncharacterized protein n=1 Tax=Thermococcus cleftensis (strain DSM 27260 / KACC 17922 / CL1) TaxID=163003 RepID=I3ZRQ2_THECF|nr:class III signal peptide-containing protein [Thermococcus cleftensis]AFL94386.1 hypothetical protein CL1_0171 [Thermococcus cleftensis]